MGDWEKKREREGERLLLTFMFSFENYFRFWTVFPSKVMPIDDKFPGIERERDEPSNRQRPFNCRLRSVIGQSLCAHFIIWNYCFVTDEWIAGIFKNQLLQLMSVARAERGVGSTRHINLLLFNEFFNFSNCVFCWWFHFVWTAMSRFWTRSARLDCSILFSISTFSSLLAVFRSIWAHFGGHPSMSQQIARHTSAVTSNIHKSPATTTINWIESDFLWIASEMNSYESVELWFQMKISLVVMSVQQQQWQRWAKTDLTQSRNVEWFATWEGGWRKKLVKYKLTVHNELRSRSWKLWLVHFHCIRN